MRTSSLVILLILGLIVCAPDAKADSHGTAQTGAIIATPTPGAPMEPAHGVMAPSAAAPAATVEAPVDESTPPNNGMTQEEMDEAEDRAAAGEE